MLEIMLENVFYRMLGYIPIYERDIYRNVVIEVVKPSVIVERVLTTLILVICVPCWVVLPLFFIAKKYPNLFKGDYAPDTMYISFKKYVIAYKVRKRDFKIFKLGKNGKWQQITDERHRLYILHKTFRRKFLLCVFNPGATGCWFNKDSDESNFKRRCFQLKITKSKKE